MGRKGIGSLLILIVCLLLAIGIPGFIESSEARYAAIGYEMFSSGDYLHPYLLGIYHFHKPPLTYMITALGYSIFGINEFGARFFLVVAYAIQLLLIYRINFLLFDNAKQSRLAMMIYAGFPIVLISVLNLTTDAYLNTFFMAAVYFYIHYHLKKEYRALYLLAIMLGLGVLTKGPVAFLPFGIFVFLFQSFLKLKWKWTIHHWMALVLCLLISVSWFAYMVGTVPKLLDYFLGYQLKDRIFNAEVFHRAEPFWYYLILIPLLIFPYSVPLIIGVFKNRHTGSNILSRVFMASAAIIIFIFSLFSSKLILYILPSSLFFASFIAYKVNTHSKQLQILIHTMTWELYILIGAGVLFFLISKLFIPAGLLSVFLLGLLYCRIKSKNWSFEALNFWFVPSLIALFVGFSLAMPSKLNSYRELFGWVSKSYPSTSTLVIYDHLIPSAELYTTKEVVTIHDRHFQSLRETQFEDVPPTNYYDLNEFEDQQHELHFDGKKVVFMVKKKDLKFVPTSLSDQFKYRKELKDWYFYSN
ncbi:ArnT family glycosyltransferase [Zunongwangia pacifica]|uniref:Glycosyltransferase family 39 protein n=1 Tax=Zunongwangia pacifica TaxID=2911062 RepID=A0A9X1ZWQ5_9FLAO|nr:glycosyltransferase family 39 protein [Zunongwangia pacifica]MCL6217736.1 glycosyltransferase family 39 protein [Zunongwangia pacifica]